VLNSKYYLRDAKYINTSTLLTLFKRIRYYLQEVIIAKQILKTYKKLFNLQHSTLRNEVKQIFNVLKRRFPFLKSIIAYNLLI
jgi:hypothetical protein